MEKGWIPGIIVTSFIFTFAWGYLVYTGDITTIWPLFGMSNQLLASAGLIIGTTIIIRLGKVRYAWITAIPGLFMTFITMWAGYENITGNYPPKNEYLLAILSIVIMMLMVVVFFGAFRRWYELLHVKTTVVDPYGNRVLTIVKE